MPARIAGSLTPNSMVIAGMKPGMSRYQQSGWWVLQVGRQPLALCQHLWTGIAFSACLLP
jgi:hypothetical protein